ncbi:MAG TPA: hypothetical protein VFS71_12805 [Flavobacterium sp.]|uniref:hypothetical protein n=1 Tax=Flavobacterium sp. TaxID=239 RepID=UPI002DBA49DB|nr:hypothetical protein [Flavobacterium sp.]HEU4790560.1 hypothetical protein [Flavobacterium sp.]
MKANSIFKFSFIIYRFILIVSIPLFIMAEFLVGMGGHNSDPNNTNYLFYVFAIITSILLTVYKQTDITKFRLKKILRYGNIFLLIISIAFVIYELFEIIEEYSFLTEETITLSLVISFATISFILLYGLFKDRI